MEVSKGGGDHTREVVVVDVTVCVCCVKKHDGEFDRVSCLLLFQVEKEKLTDPEGT